MTLPLEGIKVLELSRTLAGPLAGQLLGDLGAEIIKVEQPGSGDESRSFMPPEWDGESCYYLSTNRNKRSITVNLKDPKGLELVREIAADSDVLIENFRTGTAEKLGVGYEALKEINPRLVYLSISGFGRTGPERFRAGYDLLLQGYGGLMGTTGEAGRTPVKAGPSIVDISTGLLGAFGVLAALMARDKTGAGQYVDCSLLDGQVMMLNHFATGYYATGKSPERLGTEHQTLVPYQAFKSEDKYFLLAVGNDGLWRKMCKSLEWTDLLEDQRFVTNKLRVQYRKELIPVLAERFLAMESESIFEKMDAVGIPCGPINSVEEAITSPQAIAREMMIEVPHPNIKNLKTPAFPVKLSETPASIRRHPPLLGEHTEEILKEYGYTIGDMQSYKKDGVI